MFGSTHNSWSNTAALGSLYLLEKERDLERVGSHWMDGRLKIGDILMPYRHSGDCFYWYKLLDTRCLDVKDNTILKPVCDLPCYHLGKEILHLATRDFDLLMAGKEVHLKLEENPVAIH